MAALLPRAPAGSRSMSLSESAATLPEIPLLAPLEPITIPSQSANESVASASSVTSRDTFMTASGSPPTSISPNASKMNSHPIPSHSLRKSISVDSFIMPRRSPELSESGPSSNVQPRVYPGDSVDSDSGLDRGVEDRNVKLPNHVPVERPLRLAPNKSFASRILGRSRGHSLSGPSVADYDDPYLDDSEHERTTDMAHLHSLPINRSRSASSPLVNGYGKGKRPRAGDVLLLPPRTPTISNASSSSLSSITNGALFADSVPPVPPIPSLHNKRPNIPGPLVMPHRTRSESLSALRDALGSGGTDVLIAVVGASGCGKSTVIRKGLKNWGLSDETVCSVTTSKGRLRYFSRTINIPPGQQSARLAHVLELDSDALHLDTPDGAWPEGLPRIDGVLVCYDASDLASFARVPDLLRCYHDLHMSVVSIACKCDLEKKVPSHWASDRVAQYNVGLVEVSSTSDIGKKKMRHCFSWILRAVAHARRGEHRAGSPYRNPASPDVLAAPWADGYPDMRTGSARSRGSTPSAGSPSGSKFREHPPVTPLHHVPVSPPGTSTPTPRSPSAPTSPTRVRSTGDLLSEVQRSKRESLEGRGSVMGPLGRVASVSAGSLHEAQGAQGGSNPTDKDVDEDVLERDGTGTRKDSSRQKDNEPPPMPWATLEELLERLFFLAVSGDDSTFVEHFFLTYRKFATPRSVLLGMQKRIRHLNMDTDMLLGSYAQMRICDLLEGWIELYPTDFATPGTAGALTALVKQLLSNSSTVHYGSDLLPFLEDLPHLADLDASWSLRMDDPRDESDDDAAGLFEDGGDAASSKDAVRDPPAPAPAVPPKPKSPVQTRERKGSLSSKSLLTTQLTTTISGSSEHSRLSIKSSGVPKASIKDLLKVSQSLSQYEMLDVAEEITRQQSALFMTIEPRQWLRYAMGGCRSDPEKEPISGSAAFYNRLSNWVTSLILAHDRIKARSRQVERFSELAGLLRVLNNYAGLRAVMTGINNATYPNDEVMMLFMQNKREEYKSYRSYEVLLNSTRNHRAYRMALKHTTGPAIPDMEVHTFDMVRAHESNDDHKADDPSSIHWGKFTLMARMITTLHGFQKKILSTHKYDFTEQPHIKRLLTRVELMDEEMQLSRVIPPPDDSYEVPYPTSLGIESQNATRPDAARFKRLFFW